MTPLPMPTPQQTHMTPLPMPTASPVDMGPPANVPDYPAAPPMAPPLPPSSTPHNGSAAIEPTWRAVGTQLAAAAEVPAGPELWVAAGTRE